MNWILSVFLTFYKNSKFYRSSKSRYKILIQVSPLISDEFLLSTPFWFPAIRKFARAWILFFFIHENIKKHARKTHQRLSGILWYLKLGDGYWTVFYIYWIPKQKKHNWIVCVWYWIWFFKICNMYNRNERAKINF